MSLYWLLLPSQQSNLRRHRAWGFTHSCPYACCPLQLLSHFDDSIGDHGHGVIIQAGEVFDEVVACGVPNVDPEGKIGLGLHGQARLDSPAPHPYLYLSFPKIPSVRIRAMRENQSIIRGDACHPPSGWDVHRQPIQVATPA
jgi:hypothetical protein